MVFYGVNIFSVLLATIVSLGVGLLWYAVLGYAWTRVHHKQRVHLKPRPLSFVILIVALLVVAFMLAGLIAHLGEPTLRSGVISALLIWLGFVATTISVNYAFQNASLALFAIDAGHWLVVLLLMGAIIGAIGL